MKKNSTESPTITVGVYAERWLEGWCSGNADKVATAQSYRGLLTNHIIPQFGKRQLTSLDAATLTHDFYILTRGANPKCSAGVAKNIYKLLRMILADAMSEGLLAENPCVPEVLPEGVAAKRKAAIPEPSHFRFYEINALEKACAGEYWGPLILFAYITGLPQGELLALRLSDIIRREDDPTQYSALIRNTLKRVKTTSAGHDAKTALQLVRCKPYTIALPIRAVRIIEQRANLIRRLQELDPKRNPEQLIFTTQDGKPVEANVLRDNLVRLERKAGINEMPFSALRETAIRKAIGEAIMANRDEHTVMPQFGIRDREAFTRKYRHLIVNTKALVQEVAESERYHDSTNVQQGGLQ